MQIIRVYYLALIVSAFIFSGKKQTDTVQSMAPSGRSFQAYENKEMIKQLKHNIVINKDTNAYNALDRICMETEHKDELLYYALFMAEGSYSSKACFTTYFILYSDINKNLTTNELALYYLIKAYEMKNASAKYQILEHFNADNIPKSTAYWKQINHK